MSKGSIEKRPQADYLFQEKQFFRKQFGEAEVILDPLKPRPRRETTKDPVPSNKFEY